MSERAPDRIALRIAAVLAPLLLAACDPAGHPFEDDRPAPDAPILQVKDGVGVVVAPVEGAPGGLAEAVAAALCDLDVPASTGGGNRHSYQLAGTAAADRGGAGEMRVAIHWSMRDADGKEVGSDDEVEIVPAASWLDGKAEDFAGLARGAAKKLAAIVTEPAPAEHAPATRRLRVKPVEGAPGDGTRALPSALAYLLKQRGVAVTDDSHDASAVTVAGEVQRTALPTGKEHVKITWHVLRPDGTDVGQVAQENDVPKGSLDGRWGETAMAVAMAGLDDILRLSAAAAPPPE